MKVANNKKEKIRQFVNSLVSEKDYAFLDILWTFAYSIPSSSGYGHKSSEEKFLKRKKTFNDLLYACIDRLLTKKYSLKSLEIKKKKEAFKKWKASMPGFLSENTFDEDKKLLKEALKDKISEILLQNTAMRLQDLSALEKDIIIFILRHLPERKKACMKTPTRYLPDFSIIPIDAKIDKGIEYFEIHFESKWSDWESWQDTFNKEFHHNLKKEEFKVTSSLFTKSSIIDSPKKIENIKHSGISISKKAEMEMEQIKSYENHHFYEFGDILVQLGIGYWTFYISEKGNITISILIPNFIYKTIKS